MILKSSLVLLASFLAASPANADGLYPKSSAVLQVTPKNYDQLIAQSNHTTILEFYAPWCGHCKNLQPAYEKAAKNLEGLAKVAAINCDEDTNKGFCGQMGVQGFPTLKIVTPTKKAGKPSIEDYQGPRTAKGIVDAVVDRIPNHVKRVTDKDLDGWLEKNSDKPKAILFTEKGTTSALIRALAVDFLDAINFAQIRNKESSSVEKYGIEEFPTLVLLPGGDKDAITYTGELKKKPIVEFLSKVASPNPDPAPKNKDKKQKSSKSSSEENGDKPTESPAPKADDEAPKQPTHHEPEPLPDLTTPESLTSACLQPKSGTCVLALIPSEASESATEALTSLSEIAHKHAARQGKLFPFYSVPGDNSGAAALKSSLGVSGDVELVAVNGRRGWWRKFDGKNGFGHVEVEAWIDAIRLGEGSKEKLPAGVVAEEKAEEKAEEEVRDEL
ncbi:hypothetical protein FQN54_008215 [Arachnomyces sp. PD_36]|nr:hypothetical protein FQN54_008215 [Arachnomyces sp. PD_36]